MGNLTSYLWYTSTSPDSSIEVSTNESYDFKQKDVGLTKKYYISKELASYCCLTYSAELTVCRYEILTQIYNRLRTNYNYKFGYNGEDPDLNPIISYSPGDPIMSHPALQKRLLKHLVEVIE